MKRAVAMAAVAVACIHGCGGAPAQDRAAPKAPEAQPAPSPGASALPTTTPAAGSAAGSADQAGAPRAELRRAHDDLDRAERELRTSAGDCASACRALASMERAAGHLCDLASTPQDRALCDDAKQKVLSARERVRSTCGGCPGGPSVDRDAPIPSVRE